VKAGSRIVLSYPDVCEKIHSKILDSWLYMPKKQGHQPKAGDVKPINHKGKSQYRFNILHFFHLNQIVNHFYLSVFVINNKLKNLDFTVRYRPIAAAQ
jgi:hypothetical protein